MPVIDPKFRRKLGQYIVQCALAFVFIAGLVAFFSAVAEAVIVAALGSSAFIVFAMPHRVTALPRRLVGGHLLCLGIGLACSVPLRWGWLAGDGLGFCVVAGASVSLAILGMVITNTEHPPAAGNALAFAVLEVGTLHVVVTVGAVMLMALVRRLLRGWLQDLV